MAYMLAYRTVVHAYGIPRLTWLTVAELVLAGFGAFSVLGGFAFDRRVLQRLADRRRADLSVSALKALEWALLAPAAFAAAIALLAGGSTVAPIMLWPWVVGVPAGFGLILWLTAPAHRATRRPDNPRAAEVFDRLGTIYRLVGQWGSVWPAWVGMSLYRAADIVALSAGLRIVGLHLAPGMLILAYATGYMLTRRSLPLGGAGTVEVLMTYSLHWVNAPLAPPRSGR